MLYCCSSVILELIYRNEKGKENNQMGLLNTVVQFGRQQR